jgi:flavin-dependent dehydrogenase
MTRKQLNADVVVVGAGTAGAAAASMLAEAGRSVVLLERLSLEGAGARWVNAVPAWMFERAGIGLPEAQEIHHRDGKMILMGNSGGHGRAEVEDPPLWDLHMEKLVERLQKKALRAGVKTFEGVRIEGLELEDGRPTKLSFKARSAGAGRLATLEGKAFDVYDHDHDRDLGHEEFSVRAKLFVDASGRSMALRDHLPNLGRSWPIVPREHICTAAQRVCEIEDRAGAARFLELNKAEPEQTVSFGAVEGGWSIFHVRVRQDFERVDLLAGCIASEGKPSGTQLMERSLTEHPWIGNRLAGGQGMIPLRRPYDKLAAPGLALLGDAACMVFPMHGSGIGSGLVAARILADSVAGAEDPGAEENTWAYAAGFQRELGAVHAAYDVLRRTLQALTPQQVEQLLTTGLLSAGLVRAGLDQKLAGPKDLNPGRLPGALMQAPGLVARMGLALSRMPAAFAAYKAYPTNPSEQGLRRWSRLTARLFGDPPDLS